MTACHAAFKWPFLHSLLNSCPNNGQKSQICTGKSFSEALIFISTNPQYDNRLFIELPVQNMKVPSSEHVVYIKRSEYQNKTKNNNLCYWTGDSMKNLLSYCGLVDAKIRASDKDLLA